MAFWPMVGWIVALSAVAVMFVAMFPAFSHDVATSKKVLDSFPPQLRSALGISLETFFTFLGFYAYVLTYIGLAGAVQGMNLGLNMLNREAASGTTDFLLTRPVSRGKIFIWKFVSALAVLIVTNVVVSSVVLGAARVLKVGSYDFGVYVLLAASFFALQLIFLAIGILVSQIAGRIRSTIVVSLATCAGFFALGVLVSITGEKIFRFFTPFKYFDYVAIVSTKSFDLAFCSLAAAVIVVATVIGSVIFLKHDARSVS